MYVVPRRSSARRKLRAPSRVAGRSPTTPTSRSTRSRPLRRATRVTSSARFARCVRAPTGRIMSSGRRQQAASDGGCELADRDRPLELRLDATVGADEERPRLRREPPLAHEGVQPQRGVVPPVDLDVDEPDIRAAQATTHGVDDVDDGAAGPAGAELRRREGDDERLPGGERARDRVAQETAIWWYPRGQAREIAAGTRSRRCPRLIRLRSDRGRL